MVKLLCNWFGHKWVHWGNGGSTGADVYSCKRCKTLGFPDGK